jgi:hypothetical protein
METTPTPANHTKQSMEGIKSTVVPTKERWGKPGPRLNCVLYTRADAPTIRFHLFSFLPACWKMRIGFNPIPQTKDRLQSFSFIPNTVGAFYFIVWNSSTASVWSYWEKLIHVKDFDLYTKLCIIIDVEHTSWALFRIFNL